MAVIKELIRKENNGSISFGNYELPQKTKLADFEVNGDLYKVKTFKEITKLEKNGSFVYESIPGTAVSVFKETADEVIFPPTSVLDTPRSLSPTKTLYSLLDSNSNVICV